jgi:hypothetical protein
MQSEQRKGFPDSDLLGALIIACAIGGYKITITAKERRMEFDLSARKGVKVPLNPKFVHKMFDDAGGIESERAAVRRLLGPWVSKWR